MGVATVEADLLAKALFNSMLLRFEAHGLFHNVGEGCAVQRTDMYRWKTDASSEMREGNPRSAHAGRFSPSSSPYTAPRSHSFIFQTYVPPVRCLFRRVCSPPSPGVPVPACSTPSSPLIPWHHEALRSAITRSYAGGRHGGIRTVLSSSTTTDYPSIYDTTA